MGLLNPLVYTTISRRHLYNLNKALPNFVRQFLKIYIYFIFKVCHYTQKNFFGNFSFERS